MLAVRIGEGLREHVKSLVGRLGDRQILGKGSLQLALAYVAAMHAEGLMFLSRPVLAEVLHCQIRDLRPHVLMPLGKEAAVTGAGQFIMTRHRAIARSVVEVLSAVYGHEIDELFIDMALAAIGLRSMEFIPDFDKWEYELPEHFFKIGRKDLATRIANRILDKDPANTYLIVKLASLYRGSGDLRKATELFNSYSAELPNNRAFYYEWAISESNVGNYLLCAWLAGLSLSDQLETAQPNTYHSKLGLSGLGKSFKELYNEYNELAFIEGYGAVGHLGLRLQVDAMASTFFYRCRQNSRDADMDVDTALTYSRTSPMMSP
jgi:tetratricopeptide (TPR) repeat protein